MDVGFDSENGSSSLPEDGLVRYLREVGRCRLLTRAEERSLLEKARDGDRKSLNDLVTANLKYVVAVCGEFKDQGLPMTDLIAEGNLGLIRAAMSFDPDQGFRFTAYAIWWIRQGLEKALSDQARFRSEVREVAAASLFSKAALSGRPAGQSGRPAGLSGRPTGNPDRSAARPAQSGAHPDPAAASWAPSGGMSTGSPAGSGPVQHAQTDGSEAPGSAPRLASLASRLSPEIRKALQGLAEPGRTVLKLFFGLDTIRPMTLEEICRVLGVDHDRAEHLKEQALRQLQKSVPDGKGPYREARAAFHP